MRRGSFVRRGAVAVVAIIGVGAIGVQFTQAKLATSRFEMADGNLLGSDDWEGLGSQTTPTVKTTCGLDTTRIECSVDQPSGTKDDSFGTGTKEDTPVPSIVKGSIPNNKSDLIRAYSSSEVGTNGDNYLYLAWERVQDPSGSTNMDFEFNQSTTKSTNGVTNVRTANDLLVSYDLANGGTTPTIGYRIWITAASATDAAGTVCEGSSAFPCWSKLINLGTVKEGAINTAQISDPILIGSQTTARTLSARTFGEAAINLTSAQILREEDGCKTYGSVFLKSRSSDSFSAAVKDFIAPTPVDISNCGSVNITKTDDYDNLLGGATFQVYTATNTDEFVADDEATIGSPCTTSSTAGATLGTCSIANVPFGDFWLVETVTPSAYDTADPQLITVDLADTGGYDITVVDPRKPGSVTVVKVDDSDPALPVDGAVFQLYTSDHSTSTFDDTYETAITGATCTTAEDVEASTDGQCVIGDLNWGSYWLVETTTPSGYYPADPVLVTISSGSRDITTDPIVDPAEFKVITFVCDNNDQLIAGSVAYNGAVDPDPTETIVSGATAEQDAAIAAFICGASTGYVTSPRGDVTSDITIP